MPAFQFWSSLLGAEMGFSFPLRAAVRVWRRLRAVVRVWRRLPQPLPDQPPEGPGNGWRAHPLSQGWCLSEALCPELGSGVCTATSEPLEISGQSSSCSAAHQSASKDLQNKQRKRVPQGSEAVRPRGRVDRTGQDALDQPLVPTSLQPPRGRLPWIRTQSCQSSAHLKDLILT